MRYRIGTKALDCSLKDVLNYKLRLKELGVEYDEQKGEESRSQIVSQSIRKL